MKRDELKQKIGNQAKQIIISELGLKEKGGNFSCPVTKHSKDNCVCKWYNDSFSFFCHDCKEKYDIWNHADTKTEPYQYLCEMAGIDYKPKTFKTVKAVTKDISESGFNYLYKRGISKDTQDLYKVRSDDQWIYFNYATPDKQLVKTKWRGIQDKRFNATPGGEEILYGMHLLRSQTSLIITEGEIDALSMYEICKLMEVENNVLCSSLPNGAGSLSESCIDNSREWLDRFDEIIIVPDNDEAGKKFLEEAEKKLSNYNLFKIILPCKDANEYLLSADYNPAEVSKYKSEIIPELESCHQITKIDKHDIKNGHCSGFVTIDYNMNGLKDGWVTLATGMTGHGKTTFTRQILLSYAKQDLKSFMFCGESSISKESTLLARLTCDTSQITKSEGTGGMPIYSITDEAYDSFRDKYGHLIYMSDPIQARNGNDLFKHVLKEMFKMVKHGVKLFVLDNLMKFCVGCSDREVLSKQKEIISDLKEFAMRYNVHIVLIAHLRKDGEKIAGAQEVENTADAVLRYERLKEENKEKFLVNVDLPQKDKDMVSAYILTQKVRDEGAYNLTLIEWDASRGAVINISDLPKAIDYQARGYWTRHIPRMNETDIPGGER